MKRLGLISVLGLSLIAAPGAALAAGWSGHPGGWGGHGGGWGGGHYVAPAPRVVPAPMARVHAAPVYGGSLRYAPARGRVWRPGYWGLQGGTRIWIGGGWTFPPFAGWAWVGPHWAWDGYQWVWQEGYWAPPLY